MLRDFHSARWFAACSALGLTLTTLPALGAQTPSAAQKIPKSGPAATAQPVVPVTSHKTTAPTKASTLPTIAQFLSPPAVQEVTASKKVDRIAWVTYERGMRNVYTAVAPSYTPVKLTAFTKDDGVEVTGLKLSDDGSTVAFIRGLGANRDGWVADPDHDPAGGDRAIWAISTAGGGTAHWVAEYAPFELSPDGKFVIYARDGQIYRGRTSGVMTDSIDRGQKPFIREWGRNSSPHWSPDGTRIAYASDRTDHGFIGVYDMANRTVTFVSPSVDHDADPRWIDNKHIMFERRPGTPFGLQTTPGGGSGLPAAGGGGRAGGGGGGGGAAAAAGRGGARGAGAAGAVAAAGANAEPNACGVGGGGAGADSSTGAPGGAAGGAAGAAGAAGRGAAGGRGGGGGGGRGGRGGGRGGVIDTLPAIPMTSIPGMCNATFRGGYTAAVVVADLTTGDLKEVWRNTPASTDSGAVAAGGGRGGRGGRGGGGGGGGGARGGGGGRGGAGGAAGGLNFTGARLAGDHFVMSMRGATPNDEWDRYGSVAMDGTNAQAATLLTTTDGLIEDQTSVSISADGKTMYYCTNAGDIERRHIWAVPVAGGAPKQISTGDGVERDPTPLASGKKVAVIYFNWNVPGSVALVPAEGGAPQLIYPKFTAASAFPQSAHVKPEIVLTKPADSLESHFTIHNQLFLPKDLKPGEKRAAMIFVHGGPVREMLPAYHYMQFYSSAYAINQWLANQGYIVLSVNYRSGVGYGNSFRNAPNTGARGNSEYQDVIAGANYLRGRPDVDTKRLGIWGLSYGGQLTSEALSRNSDIFVAGADLAGVHVLGNALESNTVAYQSSSVANIDKWTSPVYLEQGDDDRNVNFAQLIGLVDLLRERNVYYELHVFPDVTHDDNVVHAQWLSMWEGMGDFLNRFVRDGKTPPKMANGVQQR